MIKKLLLTLAVVTGGAAFAQVDLFYDVAVGQRWIGTNEAGWYGSVRTYIPTNLDLFGVDVYAVPELGLDYATLSPYATLELAADADFGTLAAFVTYINGSPRINLEARFCLGSAEKCKQ